ncbi:MAG: hypothetical protein KJO44_09725 [Gemmatimonadetes bacterium]|nr:hypothetical protein [Gemmatimonadota bacterium]MBT8477618.1 hypothetical protein [Gemmatimonadota bacterium]
MKRSGYLWLTLALAAGGVVAASVGGHPAMPVVAGVGIAWIVQAVSFWHLAAGLESGERITSVWVTGMASRFGIGVLVWGLATLAGAPVRVVMIGYGLALVVFLLLEAGWLAVTTADRTVRRT